jgi:lysophospholipid acyltransferase (LPLAT)-like uncharacterized protein
MLPLLYHHRNEGVTVLISEHRDGELIARIAESLGFRTVRGSSSRGASRALVGLARELAPGALIAAQRANAPVIAVGVWAEPVWQLRTWDRFKIPRPFSRIRIAYSDPVLLDADSARAAAEETSRFQELMLEMEQVASA